MSEPDTRRILIKTAAIVAGVLVLAWAVANFYPYRVPDPLWTEADLPGVPASGNGWDHVPPATEVEMIELDSSLESILGAERPVQMITGAEFQRESLDAAFTQPAAHEALAVVEAVRAEPNFVVDCAFAEPCPQVVWFDLHKLAVLRALQLGLRGTSNDDALALLGDLIRIDRSQLETTRSLLSYTMAVINLRQALVAAQAVILERQALTGDTILDRQLDPAPVEALLDEVRKLDPSWRELQQAVIGEYLRHRAALLAVSGGSDALADFEGPRALLSPGLTLRHWNREFRQRYAAAEAGEIERALGIGERSPTKTPGWFLLNPGGRLLIAAMMFEVEGTAESLGEALEGIDAQRKGLLGDGDG